MDTIGLDLHKRESQLTKTDRRDARTLMQACRLGHIERPTGFPTRGATCARISSRRGLPHSNSRTVSPPSCTGSSVYWRQSTSRLRRADRRIAALTHDDAAVALLARAPSIGPITAAAIVATIDDITRFHSAHHFEAYLGLVQGERSSGEKRRIGRITKAGNARSSYLLVEAGAGMAYARWRDDRPYDASQLRMPRSRQKQIA